MKNNILDYDINALSVDECVDGIFQSILEGKNTWLACFNPHSYVMTLQDETFARALKAAEWVVPDGFGVLLASKLLGGMIPDRITGWDVFAGLHKQMNTFGGMSVFFLGSTEETLALIRQRMACDYPYIKIAGTYSPAFKEVYSSAELDTMINAVNSVSPDVLWVGMSAPKQEKYIFVNRARLNVKFVAAVGAVFDYFAGNIQRKENSWFVKHGLEWLPRLIQEPRRLWRRIFVSAPVFVWHVIRQKINQ